MNKLIKFISLAVILTFNFSLSCMEQTGVTDMKAQTHILTKLYVGNPIRLEGNRIECKDNRIFVYSPSAREIENETLNKTSFESLQQQGLVQQILVNTHAYELMELKLPSNIRDCNSILSSFNLKDLAEKIVNEFGDKTRLKEFTTKMLSCLNVKHPSYGSTFLLALIFRLNCTGSFILNNLTDATLFNELIKLNKEIYLLVNDLIQMKLESVKLPHDSKEPLLHSIKSGIDDSFVAASTAVVAKCLLYEINALID